METYTCKVNQLNQLDSDALLPPRKRLLAGLKRQNSDVNSPVLPPSPPSGATEEHDARNKIYRSQLNNPNLSNEDIIEASRIAAIEAVKIAEAARAIAEEKGAKAAKAVAAAKNALEVAAALSVEPSNKENFPKRSKTTKHLPVEALYNKNKGNTNYRMDEELARKLHRVINSSPRILKNSSGSDSKSRKQKKLKTSPVLGSNSICSRTLGEDRSLISISASIGNGSVQDESSECTVKQTDTIMNNRVYRDPNKSDMESVLSRDKFTESIDSSCRKRGRIKQKKLPLSICSFRDQTGTKEEGKRKGMSQFEDTAVDNPTHNNTVTAESRTMWKCQSLKVPACVKQNKVMQSS